MTPVESVTSAESAQPLIRAEEGNGTLTSGGTPRQADALVKDGHAGKEVDANDTAELQRALESLGSGTSVSEADLHKVPWFDLGWEFSVNLLVSLLAVIVVYIIMKVTPRMSLKVIILVPACILVYLLVTALYELITALVEDPEGCGGKGFLFRMPLLQAITGRKLLRLPNVSDVYIFAHALERQSSNPGAFVELVTDPQHMDQSRKLLSLDGEDIFPGEWVVSTFFNDDKDYTQELQAASSGAMYPTVSQLVKGWIFSDAGFKTPCFVQLKPTDFRSYIKHLYGHRAVRVLASATLLTVGLWPTAAYLNHLHLYKKQVCNPKTPKASQPFPFCDALNEDGETCQEHCDSLVSFISEIGSRLGVEEIEFISTIGLAVVAMFCAAIHFMRSRHRSLETKYILSTGGLSRSEEAEFMQVKGLLEDNDSFVGILGGIGKQCAAYNSELKACTPLGSEIYSGTSHDNPVFWGVTKEWRGGKSPEGNCQPFTLPLSTQEHSSEDLLGVTQNVTTWADKCGRALQELARFKNSQILSRRAGVTDKSFKFLVSVPVTCREGLELLMNEFFRKSYSSQLDAIFASKDCQDTGAESCHVSEDFRVGGLLIPAGVCLTHLACQQSNGDVCSLQVGKDKDVPTKEAFLQLLSGKENKDLNSLVLEVFNKTHSGPPVMLPSAAPLSGLLSRQSEEDPEKRLPLDSRGLSVKMKDAYVYSFSFVFQLSPSYFRASRGAEKSNFSPYGFVDNLFVNLQQNPVKEPALPPPVMRSLIALQRQSWVDAASSQYCLMVEPSKSKTLSKLFSLLSQLLGYVALAILCASFVMIVPLFRQIRWKSAMFPHPFTRTLILNGILQFFFLMAFFLLFTATARRLDLIAGSLETLERRTLGSGGSDDTDKAQENPRGGVSKALTASPDLNPSDPFQLYVKQTENYDPTDAGWVPRFRRKEQAVLNWSMCTRYIRVFVSGTRMTGQAILVCAAGVLLVFVIVVLVQGLRGYGAVGIDLSKMQAFGNNKVKQFQKSTVNSLKGFTEGKAAEAGDYVAGLGEGVAAAAGRMVARRLEDAGPLNLTAASLSLSRALEPVDAAAEESDMRDLLDVGKSLQKAGKVVSFAGDIQAITQADLLMVVLTVLLLCYSGFLLVKIARINDLADRHSSILVQAKEVHMQRQSVRERSFAAASQSAEITIEQTRQVDEAQSSYMRMLDTSIQSTQEHRSRFALKLFSFVITQGMLIAWLSAACQPLVGQLQNVGPKLAGDACMWLSTNAVTGLHQTNSAAAAALDSTAKAAGDSNLLYSLICEPILDAMGGHLNGLHDRLEKSKDAKANDDHIDQEFDARKAEAFGSGDQPEDDPDAAGDEPDAAEDDPDAADGAAAAGEDDSDAADGAAAAGEDSSAAKRRRLRAKRRRLRAKRLASGPALRRLVEDWWDANPGEPEAKFALVRAALEERQRSASQRLLQRVPDFLHLALEAQSKLVLRSWANNERRPWRSSASRRALDTLGEQLLSGIELERW